MLHTLVKYEYQPGSFPAYRHYVECTCGFEARMSNEVSVKNQFDSHLVAHGVEPYFEKPITPNLPGTGSSEVKQEKTATGDVLNPTLRPDEVKADAAPGATIEPKLPTETPDQQAAPDEPVMAVDQSTENTPDSSKKN